MPRSSILGMFGRSPIRPLQAHMTKTLACVEKLRPFFEAVLAQDWETAETIQVEISTLEQEADALKKAFRLQLPKGLFLPVPRTDLLELIRRQDTVANQAKHMAGLVVGRKMVLPEAISSKYAKFLDRSIRAAAQAHKAISELDELLESGFRGSEAKVVSGMISKLDRIENDTDKKQVEVRRALFAIEDDLPPIQVMFLYKIIDGTGELADRAQRVGSHLQLLLAR